jgi:hypothetical protein
MRDESKMVSLTTDVFVMDKKKILIVSRSFYPMNSPRSLRTTELVKEFARQGHEVTLLTIKNDEVHIPFEEEHDVTIKDLGHLWFPKVELAGSSGIIRLFKRLIRRVLLLLFEYPDIELMFKVNRALKKESGFDLLISVAAPYPVHWGVAKARNPNHPIAETWIADCGDPYVGRQNDSFKVPFYFSFVEKWFFRKADFITVPFDGAKSAYFPEFRSKIKVIPQGLSFPKRTNNGRTVENDVITFAYFGNIESYLHYAVPFLNKLNSIKREFRFIIYTRRKDIFETNLTPETLDKCFLRDYVEREVLFRQLDKVDFLVHFPYQNEIQKSLKLVDYNFIGKPILVYKNDESSDRIFKEFLEYNFENKREFEDYRKYKIENVCTDFLKLADNKVHSTVSG